jgi:hypothetical protein
LIKNGVRVDEDVVALLKAQSDKNLGVL